MKVTNNTPSNVAIGHKTVDATKQAGEKSGKDRAGEVRDARGNSANVEISDTARLMRKATDVVNGAPDVRAEKVAALKKAIQEGTYRVDAEKVAEKVIEEHLSGDFGKNRF